MTTDLVETKTDTESESPLDEKQQAAEQAGDKTALSPGDRLQQARLHKGLTIEQVGEKLKIPASYIDIIDRSQFEKLPGLMFARGYIRSYARVVGLDADELIDSFDQFTGDNSQNTPKLSEGKDVEIRRQVSPVVSIGGVVSVVCILLVIAFSYYNWGGGQDSPASSEVADEYVPSEPAVAQTPAIIEKNPLEKGSLEEGSLEESTAAPDESEPVSEPLVDSSTSKETYPSDNSETFPVDALSNEASTVEPGEPEIAEANEAEPVAPAEPAVAEEPRLVVRFSADCWIQVRDMRGRNLYTDVQKAGSSLELEVPSAIQVRFGNVPGVQSVTFNGEPVEVTTSQPGRKVVSLVLGSEDAG